MRRVFLLVLIIISGCLAQNPFLSDTWKSRINSSKTVDLVSDLVFPELLQRWLESPHHQPGQSPVCDVCDVMVEMAITARRQNTSNEVVAQIFVHMCKWFKLETESFCEHYVKDNLGIWLYIIDNKPSVRPRTFCVYALHWLGCQDPERKDWTVALPPPQRARTVINHQGSSKSPLKILHLTDIHYDPGYEVGSSSTCDLMLCCQKGMIANTSADEAGYWGSYPCDSPWHAVEDVLNQVIKAHHSFDAIYFTGDIIKHSQWLTGKSANTDDILKVFDEFKKVFNGLPVFPTLGNHESFPAHQFSSDGISESTGLSTQWLYDLVGKSWETWLSEESLQTVRKSGHYTALVKPGLRVIALNNNVAYTYNSWLYFEDEDPLGQLQWMIEILSQAEINGEKVHIISHVPSSDPLCFFNWGKEYTRIIERFAHIIVGQFHGHSHDEDFIVYFSSQNRSEAINVAYVGGSATTFRNLNPNYKIFEIDAKTYDTLNYETWIYNLTEANLTPNNSPRWYKLYDPKSAFNLPSLHPNDIADVVRRMTREPGLLQDYYRYKKRDADPAMAKGCDRKCQLENLCYMVTPWYGENLNCVYYTEMFNKNHPSD